MKSNLYIPKKIRVGFQKRKDTFNGKLAYVICYDEKGKLRKETSWEGWRDKSIPYIELDNYPVDGFMFNKGVERYGYFGSGRSLIRIHHPDEFEFEVSIDNLIGILMNTDVSKRYIQGKCVFAWAGKDLVLLPINSVEYQEATKYTEKQSANISTKDLKKGFKYSLKKSEELFTYLGYFEYYSNNDYINLTNYNNNSKAAKKHIFYSDNGSFTSLLASQLANCVSNEVDQEYQNYYDKFFKSIYSKNLNTIILDKPDFTISKNRAKSIYKDFGENLIISVSKNINSDNKIYFDKYYNRATGINFFAYKKTDSGYQSYTKDYYYSDLLNLIEQYIPEHKKEFKKVFYHSIKEVDFMILKLFPELFTKTLNSQEFLKLAEERGFKTVYVASSEDSDIKVRI
jgi:hypothetical protein